MSLNVLSTALDADESLHLAIHASKNGDFHAAISYLKELLSQDPANAAAIYFLATQHAEIGLYERAISGMQQAISLDPQLETARFQLGLLFLQLNRVDEAKSTLEELAKVATDPALVHFAPAYIALIGDDLIEAEKELSEGIALCDHNPALKSDMSRVLSSLADATVTADDQIAVQATSAVTQSAHFLGAYRDTDDSDVAH